MNRKMYRAAALLLSACLLTGCADNAAEKSVSLDEKDFEVDEEFITIVDSTPNPFNEEEVQLYIDLGIDIFMLPEDYVPMVENGTLSDSYKKAIETLGEKGLKVWIRNMWNDPDYFQCDAQKTGSNYGSPYIMEARNITTEFLDYPQVTGFYMADEAYMTTLEDNPETDYDETRFSAMDQLSKLVEWKNKYYPDAYWHMNHVPSSSYDHWPSGYSYADFIQYYVDNIIKKLESGERSICLDNYPLPEGGGTISESYLLDLLTVANIARDYNAEAEEGQKANYGICLQTFRDSTAKLRDITSSADVTFQMYTGMAMGARLFEYFLWRTYDGLGLYGMVDETGQPRIYDYVKEANEKALPFEKVILGFDWQGLTTSIGESSGENDTFENVGDLVIKDTGSLSSVSSRYDTIVGCFKKDKQDGFMVVNYNAPDLDVTNVVMLEFKDCSQALIYTEDGIEKVNLVEDGKLRLTLEAGEAAFVIPAP